MDALAKFFEDLRSEIILTIKSGVGSLKDQDKPMLISSSDYCRANNIARQTLYKWRDKGIIQTEKKGGKLFVVNDSVIRKKYQRELA